jgi:hypothetical protein
MSKRDERESRTEQERKDSERMMNENDGLFKSHDLKYLLHQHADAREV